MRLGPLEIFVLQLIVYSLIYAVNPYLGFLICLVLGAIATAIFILSFIFELIEKSKVPRSYYWYILTTVIAPFTILALFSIFMRGSFDWMKG